MFAKIPFENASLLGVSVLSPKLHNFCGDGSSLQCNDTLLGFGLGESDLFSPFQAVPPFTTPPPPALFSSGRPACFGRICTDTSRANGLTAAAAALSAEQCRPEGRGAVTKLRF